MKKVGSSESKFTAVGGYNIELVIDDIDYTDDIDNLRIMSSINAPYQLVIIDLIIDQNDILGKKLFGREPLKLHIRFRGRGKTNASIEDMKFELVQLKDNSGVRNKNTLSDTKSKEPTKMTLYTVPRNPMYTITKAINDIYYGKTVKQIIEDMVSKYTKAELVYDSDDQNSRVIKCVHIPNITLYKAIRFLDDGYGIFNGASNLGFCQYDNKLYIQNLTKRMTKNQTFTIHHLANDSKDTGKIMDLCNDGKNFYSLSPLGTKYSGNQILANLAKTVVYNVKPSNALYKEITKNFDDWCGKYGVVSKSGVEFPSDPIFDDRERYKITSMGDDDSDIFINSQLGRAVLSLATVKVELQKDLQFTNLINVGEAVKLETKTAEHIDISGKYILKSSDILFTRESKNWAAFATIMLCRTNKSI